MLAVFIYDNLGSRTTLTFGNGTSQAYGYDPVARLTARTANLGGTTNDLTIGSIAYNPASQVVSQNRSNVASAWAIELSRAGLLDRQRQQLPYLAQVCGIMRFARTPPTG